MKVWVLRGPLEDQPDEEACDRVPGRRAMEGGGKRGGFWVNQRVWRSRGRSIGVYVGVEFGAREAWDMISVESRNKDDNEEICDI